MNWIRHTPLTGKGHKIINAVAGRFGEEATDDYADTYDEGGWPVDYEKNRIIAGLLQEQYLGGVSDGDTKRMLRVREGDS